jgi:hypothetical protein
MSSREKLAGKVDERAVQAESEALEQALRNFRSSVHAWSEAVYSQPRTPVLAVRHGSWRLAAGWALGCLLAVGSVAGGVYERHHRQEAARMAAAQAARQTAAQAATQQQPAVEQSPRQEDEDLLAKVDSDVSRQVPSAMEPLAQLMAGDATE